jgi:hypothetical protein
LFPVDTATNLMHILIFLLIGMPLSLFAQSSSTGAWLIYFGDKKINDKWNWHYEVQYRSFELFEDTEQLLIRTGLGYNLTERNNNVHLGSAFVYSEPYIAKDEKIFFTEHRIYQQFITRQHFGPFTIKHRYRFEQRFFEAHQAFRFRYFLGVNMALTDRVINDGTVYLSSYNEFFITPGYPFFDRNRFYGGLGYQFSSVVRAELGVMNQTTNQVSRNQVNIITFVRF